MTHHLVEGIIPQPSPTFQSPPLSRQSAGVKLTDALPAFWSNVKSEAMPLFFKQILYSRHCASCFTCFLENLSNDAVKPLVIFLI